MEQNLRDLHPLFGSWRVPDLHPSLRYRKDQDDRIDLGFVAYIYLCMFFVACPFGSRTPSASISFPCQNMESFWISKDCETFPWSMYH
jgi:hypothetical protein